MAIALVRKAKAACNSQASLTFTVNNVAAGNKLILLSNNWQEDFVSDGGVATITSSPSAVWRKDVAGIPYDNYTELQAVQSQIWSADVVTAGSHTITVNFVGSLAHAQVVVCEFSGLMTGATSLDITQTYAESWDQPTVWATPDTSQAIELVISTTAVQGNTSFVGLNPPPVGTTSPAFTNLYFDEDIQTTVGFSADYRITTVAGPQGPKYGPLTHDGSWYKWNASLATYKSGVPSGQATTVVLNSGTSWAVPSNISNLQLVEVWGGGGSGGNRGSQPPTGGGGGAYSAITNYPVTPGQSIPISIGAGGIQQTVADDGFNGGDTWFASTTTLLAKGGGKGLGNGTGAHAGGVGGQASAGVGTTKFSGGNGGSGQVGGSASGGGGSATKSSNGANGVNTTTAVASRGGAAGTGGGVGGIVDGTLPPNNTEGAGGGAGTITDPLDAQAGGLPGGGGGAVGGAGNYSGAGGGGQIRITYSALAPVSVTATGATFAVSQAFTAGAATPQRFAAPAGTTRPVSSALTIGSFGGTTNSDILGQSFKAKIYTVFGYSVFAGANFFSFDDTSTPMFDRTTGYTFDLTVPGSPAGVTGATPAILNASASSAFSPGTVATVRGATINGGALPASSALAKGNIVGIQNGSIAGVAFTATSAAVFGTTSGTLSASVAGINFVPSTANSFGLAVGTTVSSVSGVAFTAIAAAAFSSPVAVKNASIVALSFTPSVGSAFGQASGINNTTFVGLNFFASANIGVGTLYGGISKTPASIDYAVDSRLTTGAIKGIDNKIQAGVAHAISSVFSPGILAVGLAGFNGGSAFTTGASLTLGQVNASRFVTPNRQSYSPIVNFVRGSVSTVRRGIGEGIDLPSGSEFTPGVGLSGITALPAGISASAVSNFTAGGVVAQKAAIPNGINQNSTAIIVGGSLRGAQNPVVQSTALANTAAFTPGQPIIARIASPAGAVLAAASTVAAGGVQTQRGALPIGGTFNAAQVFLPGGITAGFNASASGSDLHVDCRLDTGDILGRINLNATGGIFVSTASIQPGSAQTVRFAVIDENDFSGNIAFLPGSINAVTKRGKVRITLIVGSLVDNRVVIE